MKPRALPGSVFAAALTLSLATTGAAQCALEWQPTLPVPVTNHRVNALAPLPQGGLVAAGWFQVAGSTAASRVARWDGVAWHPLGAGIDGAADAAVVMPNGDVVVGGSFLGAGGNAIPFVARWDGSTWSPLGAGLDGPVHALRVAPNGDLLAGGAFSASGGQPVGRLARFDGTSWAAAGAPITAGLVYAVEVLPNGAIAIGGQSLVSGGAGFVAAIDTGTGWQSVGASVPAPTFVLRALQNGHLACGGRRRTAVNDNLAIFDGTNLQVVVTPLTGDVRALLVEANGDLVVGGGAAGANVTGLNVARRTSAGWQNLLVSNYTTFAFAEQNGRLVAAGGPTGGAPVIEPTVREHQAPVWVGLGGDASEPVTAVEAGPGGVLYVAGTFTQLGGVPAARLAQRVGTTWAPLGLGVDDRVTAMATDAAGGLVVGGEFTAAGGAPANRIARWNGTSWSTFGNGLAEPPTSVATGPGDRVVAVSAQRVHVFANGVWTLLPPSWLGGEHAVVVLPDGSIVATSPGSPSLRRWDGAAWTTLPAAPHQVAMSAAGADGSIFVAGASPIGFRVSRWNGASWQTLGASFDGVIRSLEPLPNGDVVALGFFANVGGVPAPAIARWDGTAWQPVDGGLTTGLASASFAEAAAMTTSGELFVVGNFALAGDVVSARIARAVSPCPASATSFGAGCYGSAGPMALVAQTLPWTGATFRSRATTFPPLAVAVHVLGTTPVVASLPLGAPGCSRLTSLDVLELMLATNGVVEPAFVVPSNPALVGATARTQVIGIELDPSLAIVRTTATNALVLTVGAY